MKSSFATMGERVAAHAAKMAMSAPPFVGPPLPAELQRERQAVYDAMCRRYQPIKISELAGKLGVDFDTALAIACCQVPLDDAMAVKLAEVLGESVEYAKQFCQPNAELERKRSLAK